MAIEIMGDEPKGAGPAKVEEGTGHAQAPVRPIELTFGLCIEYATRLKEDGEYAIAGRLFKEAADLSEGFIVSRSLAVEAMACYVHAGNLGHAKEIARQLHASPLVLAPVEAAKVDAVLLLV